MKWLVTFLTSSIGKKVVMSLTGLFLILFLVVHLIGNLALLYSDGGKAFNIYTEMMTGNPIIKTIGFGLYFFIILHAVQGIILYLTNRKSKGVKYAAKTGANATWASKNMMLLGTLVLAFLFIHMGDFWMKIKFTEVPFDKVTYEEIGYPIENAYAMVMFSFSKLWIVVAYLIGLLALAFHLNHGFASAFQTLGLNHKKYTPIIAGIGKAYSILVPLGFAIIPLYFFFTK